MIGKTISHYRIVEKLGVGGMGIVYKAQDIKLDRFVALKFLPPRSVQADEEKKRFIQEAKATSALDHPNICTIYEIDETKPAPGEPGDGQMFIAMAFYDGAALKDKIESHETGLPIDEAVDIAIQIAQGLQRAHEEGIIHRDIKPANIMLTQRNEVKIVDFGLAKLMGQTMLTKSGTTLGTVAYMSPEQTHGAAVDHRSDIWALGVILHEMLTGERPFKGDYDQAVIYSIMNEDPEPMTELRADLPTELEQVITKCLAKDPNERYQNADEVVAVLKIVTEPSSAERAATTGPGKAQLPERKFGRNMAFIGLGIAIVVAAFLAITNFFGTKNNTPPVDKVTAPVANRIAVFPFSVRGAADLAYLREGMADLLSTNLDGAGELKTVSQQTLLKVISRKPDTQLDTDNSSMISKRMDAGRFVLGNILEAGGRLRINASLYEIDKGSESVATATAEGTPGDLFAMTDNLTAQIIAAVSKKPAERLTRLATRTTNSFVALKAYLEGEKYRTSGRIQDAVIAYQRAVAEDTTFALAYYRMARMAGFSPVKIDVGQTLNSAVRHATRLSERNRLIIEAYSESRQGDFFKAEELYGNIVSLYPDEVDAWVTLANIQWYLAGRSGHSLDAARKSLERAVYYDPNNLPAVPWLWIFSVWEGHQARSDSLAERTNALVPPHSEKSIQTRAWVAFSKGGAAEQEQIIEEARGAHSFEVWLTSTFFARMPTIHRNPQLFSNTVKFIRLLNEPTRSVQDRYNGYALVANLYLSGGSWQAARKELVEMVSIKPVDGLQDRALVYLFPFLEVGDSELADLRKEIVDLNYDPIQAPLLRYYFAGLLSARLGDHSLAHSYADSLESHSSSLMTQEQTKRLGAMGVDFALSVRAHVAWNEGDFQKALDLLDQGEPEKWWPFMPRRAFEVQTFERYMRAELLKSLGRYEEALRWYASLGIGASMEFFYIPVSHFRQAEVYEQLGQLDEAAERYSKFIEMWKDCDAELRPIVVNAEKSLERLLKEKAREPGKQGR